jgi:putative SOS response-associated peptidase YedK
MCGCVGTKDIRKVVRDYLQPTLFDLDDFTPNNNVRPTNAIVGLRPEGRDLKASLYTWGYLPASAKDKSFISAYSTFNATKEKAPTGRLYGQAFKQRRMLLVSSAWFEWAKWNGKNKPGIAHTILPTEAEVFVFAGLWVAWKDPATGIWEDTATMMTTPASQDFSEIHHRMPAVLQKDAWKAWLDPSTSMLEAQELLQPCPTALYQARLGGPAQFAVV